MSDNRLRWFGHFMKKDESKIVIGDAKYCREDKGRLQKFMIERLQIYEMIKDS